MQSTLLPLNPFIKTVMIYVINNELSLNLEIIFYKIYFGSKNNYKVTYLSQNESDKESD